MPSLCTSLPLTAAATGSLWAAEARACSAPRESGRKAWDGGRESGLGAGERKKPLFLVSKDIISRWWARGCWIDRSRSRMCASGRWTNRNWGWSALRAAPCRFRAGAEAKGTVIFCQREPDRLEVLLRPISMRGVRRCVCWEPVGCTHPPYDRRDLHYCTDAGRPLKTRDFAPRFEGAAAFQGREGSSANLGNTRGSEFAGGFSRASQAPWRSTRRAPRCDGSCSLCLTEVREGLFVIRT